MDADLLLLFASLFVGLYCLGHDILFHKATSIFKSFWCNVSIVVMLDYIDVAVFEKLLGLPRGVVQIHLVYGSPIGLQLVDWLALLRMRIFTISICHLCDGGVFHQEAILPLLEVVNFLHFLL
jgi:hypothetical protein